MAGRLRLLQAQRVHPPAVADGVEEPAAAGGARVAARHVGRAVLHQAAAATRRVHRVCFVTLRKRNGDAKVILLPKQAGQTDSNSAGELNCSDKDPMWGPNTAFLLGTDIVFINIFLKVPCHPKLIYSVFQLASLTITSVF